MIVSRWSEALVLATQIDHQDQCRRMAEAWGGGGFERIADWPSVVTAAATHDEGWRDVDAAPTRDADGRLYVVGTMNYKPVVLQVTPAAGG